MSLPKEVQKKLGYYVYALVDPRDDKIFYVGKGTNNRAFDHLKGKDSKGIKGSKRILIEEIIKSGKAPRIDIIRHGLADEQTAFEVEAAIIDVIGLDKLTNEVNGHHRERGYFPSDSVVRMYGAETVNTLDLPSNVIAFFLNQTYHPKIGRQELYDATRQFWDISLAKVQAIYENDELVYPLALAVVDSVVVAVYQIQQWSIAGGTLSTRISSLDPTPRNKKGKELKEFVGQLIEGHELVNVKLIDGEEPLKANQNGFTYLDVL